MINQKPNERISELKENMSSKSADQNLQSLFLISSCANENDSHDWYQDYDIHFLFKEIHIPTEKLDWLRQLLENSANQSNTYCKIEWFVKDRHWKMVPQSSFPINIGIHATLLNAADYFRRLHYNPILASNMYGRCNLLYGDHPNIIRGYRSPTVFDYLHSVGGIGWLAENFSRAVALYQLTPDDHTFYPFISGYCWNIASSIMFHSYTLSQGGLSGRKNAFESFLSIDTVQSNLPLMDAAKLLYENREYPKNDTGFAKPLINAVGLIIEYARKCFLLNFPINFNHKNKITKNNSYLNKPFYINIMKKLTTRNDDCQIIDIFRDENIDYYDSISKALSCVKKDFGEDISPKENFEFVRETLIKNKIINKIRIWDSISYFRFQHSHDFNLDNGINSNAAIIFGWEDGFQTILQRLNEVYIEKSGEIDDELLQLCQYTELLLEERVSSFHFDLDIKNNRNSFDQTRERLSKLLELYCHSPKIKNSSHELLSSA